MPDLHYEDQRLADLYDIDSGWSVDRDFYLSLAGPERRRILDLGCGTGLICDRYAALGHAVTGVDPAAAMLAVARRKPHGGRVEWVHSTAEAFRSDKRFDLIIMTGHAFQVLLEEAQILATLAMVREHLAEGGRFVFESRNPAIDWKARWHGGGTALELDGQVVQQRSRVLSASPERVVFEASYAFADATLVSRSELLFLARAEIERLIAASGLVVESFYGDWDRSAFDAAASEEMIFVVGKAG